MNKDFLSQLRTSGITKWGLDDFGKVGTQLDIYYNPYETCFKSYKDVQTNDFLHSLLEKLLRVD